MIQTSLVLGLVLVLFLQWSGVGADVKSAGNLGFIRCGFPFAIFFSARSVKILNRELFTKFSRKVSHKFFTSANIIIRDNPAEIFHEQQFPWKEVKSLRSGFVCSFKGSSFWDSVALYTLCDDDFCFYILCPSSQHSLPVPNMAQ